MPPATWLVAVTVWGKSIDIIDYLLSELSFDLEVQSNAGMFFLPICSPTFASASFLPLLFGVLLSARAVVWQAAMLPFGRQQVVMWRCASGSLNVVQTLR